MLLTIRRDDREGLKHLVGLAIPFWRMIYSKSMVNLLTMVAGFPFYTIHTAENFRVDRAREEMTAQFLVFGGTHMLCLDSDMEIPVGAVERLLAHDLDIVAGLYYSRHTEHYPFIWGEDPERGRFFVAEWPEGALVQCDLTGSGILLIKREVFEAFGPPWWLLEEGDAGGTDIAFLRRTRKAGFDLFVDTSIVCGHYGVSRIGPEDFEEWKREHEELIIED